MKRWMLYLFAPGALAAIWPAAAGAAPVLMSAEWAERACRVWNEDPVLTEKLVESGWIDNDKDRGYKVLHLYRTDCGGSPRVELRIAGRDGRAMCVYGGAVQTEIDERVDYVMHAKTKRWQEMGAGRYGPMRAMLLGRLQFSGPMWEAMKNMGPFKSFLRIAGKVAGDVSSCP